MQQSLQKPFQYFHLLKKRYLDTMEVSGSSSPFCLFSVKENVSYTLGIISVVVWVVAEIPQIMTNYRNKSAEGLSAAFLTTWILGDIFNLLGCMLEPATLPTQYYMAVLYTFITLALTSQTIYYGHIYPRLKCNRQVKVETLKSGQSNSGEGKDSDANQCNGSDAFNKDNGRSSPISFPTSPQKILAGGELYYQSARYLSKSHTPTAGSVLASRVTSTSNIMDSIEEPLLASTVSTKSEPDLKIKNSLCLVSTFTFVGALNLLLSPDRRPNSMVIAPRHEFVIQVGRKLLQVSGVQSLEHGSEGSGGIGALLGWAMAAIYMGGRLPQICLNMKRRKVEGLNPLMFLFALIGNGTYVASILVNSVEWSKIGPNLPWLVDAAGCVLLDFFILLQFAYFRCSTSQGKGRKYEHQVLA